MQGRSKDEIWAAIGWELSKEVDWQKDSDYIKVPDTTVKSSADAMNGKIVSGQLKDLVDLGNPATLYPELNNVYLDFYIDQHGNSFALYTSKQ